MAAGFGSYSSGLNISGLISEPGSKASSPVKSSLSYEEKKLPPCQNETLSNVISKSGKIKRIYLTIATYLAFLGCGFSVGVVGPTLVHLEYLYNTDTSGISKAFIGINIGYIIGTIVCAVSFDRFNREIQFTIWSVANSLLLASIPWVPALYYYYIITTLQNLAQGFMFSSAQSYIVKLWHDHASKGPLVIGCYMAWSLGSFTCPFIAMPFLDDIEELKINNNSTAILGNNTTIISNLTIDIYNQETGALSGVYKVRYAYGIVGLMNCLTSFLFIVGFIFNGPSWRAKNFDFLPTDHLDDHVDVDAKDIDNKDELANKKDIYTDLKQSYKFKILKVAMIVLLWLFAVSYVWTEYTIGCYIALFSIKELHWEVDKGALVTAIYYGSLGIGRLLGLGVAKILIPVRVLSVDICLTALATILLLFAKYNKAIIWVAVGMAGCAMATIVPSTFLWMSDYMPITGVISGIYMSGIATGCMLSGYLVGYLFDNNSRMWVIYSCFGFSVLTVVFFIALAVVSKIFKVYQDRLKDGKTTTGVNGTQSNIPLKTVDS